MTVVYVAKSASLQTWASDVGLTKHVYKIGVSEAKPAETIQALNDEGHAGRSDWTLVKALSVDAAQEDDALRRLASKETAIDPTYYPQIKAARGIFKIKPANAENHFIIESALNGRERKSKRLTSAEIGLYLIRNAIATDAASAT
jgi:hypothetical protein